MRSVSLCYSTIVAEVDAQGNVLWEDPSDQGEHDVWKSGPHWDEDDGRAAPSPRTKFPTLVNTPVSSRKNTPPAVHLKKATQTQEQNVIAEVDGQGNVWFLGGDLLRVVVKHPHGDLLRTPQELYPLPLPLPIYRSPLPSPLYRSPSHLPSPHLSILLSSPSFRHIQCSRAPRARSSDVVRL